MLSCARFCITQDAEKGDSAYEGSCFGSESTICSLDPDPDQASNIPPSNLVSRSVIVISDSEDEEDKENRPGESTLLDRPRGLSRSFVHCCPSYLTQMCYVVIHETDPYS